MEKRAYVLNDMTWPEVEEALKTVRVAIIPTGANEQHGPHLVMRTDIANATLPHARILHPWPEQRLAAIIQGRSRMR